MSLKISGKSLPVFKPNLDIDLIWQLGVRSPNGYSDKNQYEFIKEENARFIITDPPIIFWRIFWNFKLLIYNNSTVPIFNLKVETIGQLQFDYLSNPPKKNNLPPLQNIDLEAKSYQQIEGTFLEADELLQQQVPSHLEGLKLRLSYQDERENLFQEIFEMQRSEFVKNKYSS